MTDTEIKAGRAKSLRMMQYFGAGSTLLCALVLYFFMPDKQLGLLISGLLFLVAVGEFFIFRAMADKAHADL